MLVIYCSYVPATCGKKCLRYKRFHFCLLCTAIIPIGSYHMFIVWFSEQHICAVSLFLNSVIYGNRCHRKWQKCMMYIAVTIPQKRLGSTIRI